MSLIIYFSHDLINEIINQLENEMNIYDFDDIKKTYNTILNLYLSCPDFKNPCLLKMKRLKRINYFRKKYYKVDTFFYDELIKTKQNNYLYIALSSGCTLPYAYHTTKICDVKDIYELIELLPECLNFNLGILRCRSDVNVLHMACINDKVPVEIVKLLLKKGLDPNYQITINYNQKRKITDDILDNNKYTTNKICMEKINLLTNY